MGYSFPENDITRIRLWFRELHEKLFANCFLGKSHFSNHVLGIIFAIFSGCVVGVLNRDLQQYSCDTPYSAIVLGPPKQVYVPHFLERTQRDPHKRFRRNFGGKKRGPQTGLFWATKSLVYCCFLPFVMVRAWDGDNFAHPSSDVRIYEMNYQQFFAQMWRATYEKFAQRRLRECPFLGLSVATNLPKHLLTRVPATFAAMDASLSCAPSALRRVHRRSKGLRKRMGRTRMVLKACDLMTPRVRIRRTPAKGL